MCIGVRIRVMRIFRIVVVINRRLLKIKSVVSSNSIKGIYSSRKKERVIV